MKFKTFITITSILAFGTGALCVLIPSQLLSSYNVSLTPMGLIIYQFWGVALIGLGALTWIARNLEDAATQKRFALSLFITYGLSCLMAVRGQFAGANAFGWSTVALFFLLSVGFGAFAIKKI